MVSAWCGGCPVVSGCVGSAVVRPVGRCHWVVLRAKEVCQSGGTVLQGCGALNAT